MHDLVIRGALILDGKGGRPFTGDLAVDAGRIAQVGGVIGEGAEEVQAGGLALMPGIIDSHTHYDAQVTWDPLCDPSPALGVTTVVMGNCGFTIAPCKAEDRQLMMGHLTRVEGMSIEALQQGIDWGFRTFPEYLDMVEAKGVGPNVAVYIGHSALRTFVLGAAATERAATAEEIGAMCALVDEAMEAGALGFSSSTHEQHVGWGGVPMPSRLAETDEFEAIVKTVGAREKGTLMLVKGSKTSIAWIEHLASLADRPVLVSAMRHHPAAPDKVFEDLAALRNARERGRRLYGQCSCMPMAMDFSLENPYPFEGYDAWKRAIEADGRDAYIEVLKDSAFRAAMKHEIETAPGMRIFRGNWETLTVATAGDAANRSLEDRAIGELAREAGKHPFDYFLDLGLEEDLKTLFATEFSNYDVPSVGRILADPDNQISLGDAGAHLSFLCEAGYGLHLLGRWVRDLAVLSLAEAARRLSGQQANLFGIADRGTLEPGMAADLVLFDPATVGIGPKQRLFDLPGGATRLRTDARGLHGVWVNGVKLADGTGPIAPRQMPGKVLRDFVG
ncbi:N-acyl-D-amino-acid deacylase family protein [Sphingomonas profundi]|uniref:N-acyl-D-amino-acid deacylase family protein n=1 Tax=Alterirhizorhabdus profundi TaxID=2681549 RepID=UPI0012E7C92B|nr:amidohydrolase family protein [Sphingomonas profundi]